MIPVFKGDIIQRLRSFERIVRMNGFSRAAKDLYCHPSALYYQIKSLEKEFNIKLLNTKKGIIEPTEDGYRLLKWCDIISDILNNMKNDFINLNSNFYEKVNIATLQSIAQCFFSKIINIAQTELQIQMYIKTSNFRDILNMVKNKDIDFAISLYTDDNSFIFKELFTEYPVLVLPLKKNIELPANITLEDISKMPLIAYTENPFHFIHPKYKVDININIILHVQSALLAINYVQAGLGCAIVSRHLLTSEMRQNLIVKELHWEHAKASFGTIQLAGEPLKLQAQALLELIHNEKDNWLGDN